MLRTRFTELVGCEAPIQLAPMGSICTIELVVAVTSAGGMGMVAPHLAPPPVVAQVLDTVIAKAPGPVGINFLMPFVDRAAVEVAAERANVVDFYHAGWTARWSTSSTAAGRWPAGRSARSRTPGPRSTPAAT
jgi:NAD(P)H-dependent flavin oxidoreductase YrpB (nitropropane dioxygenase family)